MYANIAKIVVVGLMPFLALIINQYISTRPERSLQDISVSDLDLDIALENHVFQNKLADPDMSALKQEITKVLGNEIKTYGVYIYDLTRNKSVSINGNLVLPPASISKIPVAILILKDVDKGKLSLSKKYPIKSYNKPYTHDFLSKQPNGKRYTLKQYLWYSIIRSDNTANATLEEILGGYSRVNQRTRRELGVKYFFRWPHQATANDIGKVFKGIYEQNYLSKESNELLLKYLLNTASWLQDGIPGKLPEDIKVAHKTGQIEGVWEDAGIIYSKYSDFIVVVINKKTTPKRARARTQNIALTAFEYLNYLK